jgi:hypothetical protein
LALGTGVSIVIFDIFNIYVNFILRAQVIQAKPAALPFRVRKENTFAFAAAPSASGMEASRGQGWP